MVWVDDRVWRGTSGIVVKADQLDQQPYSGSGSRSESSDNASSCVTRSQLSPTANLQFATVESGDASVHYYSPGVRAVTRAQQQRQAFTLTASIDGLKRPVELRLLQRIVECLLYFQQKRTIKEWRSAGALLWLADKKVHMGREAVEEGTSCACSSLLSSSIVLPPFLLPYSSSHSHHLELFRPSLAALPHSGECLADKQTLSA